MTNSSTPIEYFRKEAKKLFKKVKANETEALARVQRVLKDHSATSLMRVQHVIAVEFGFSKWEELIGTSTDMLQSLITKKLNHSAHLKRLPRKNGTPLGNFVHGPGILSTSPEHEALADMFDKMTPREQELYLDEDAQTKRLLNYR